MFDGIGITTPLKMCLQIGLFYWGVFQLFWVGH